MTTDTDKKIEEAFEAYWHGTFKGMSSEDYIKYKSVGKSTTFTGYKAGYLAAMNQVRNKQIGFCDSCDDFANLGCSPYFPRDHLVCEQCHKDEKKRGEDE